MDELIKVKDKRIEEYEELLLKKEALLKECYQIEQEYLRQFGKLLYEAFERKVECIKKKKIIAYCQKLQNQGKDVEINALNTYIDTCMEEYYQQLETLLKDLSNAKASKWVSDRIIQKIKKIYYGIAKKIHPDTNPTLKDDKTVRNLWDRTVIAYRCNDLNEIEEIDFLVDQYLNLIDYKHTDIVVNQIEKKIKDLEKEIIMIISTDPYLLSEFINDPTHIKEKKEELKKEIEEYTAYSKELDEVIQKFNIEKRLS